MQHLHKNKTQVNCVNLLIRMIYNECFMDVRIHTRFVMATWCYHVTVIPHIIYEGISLYKSPKSI